jgi:hypothetical protein
LVARIVTPRYINKTDKEMRMVAMPNLKIYLAMRHMPKIINAKPVKTLIANGCILITL